MKIFVVNIHTFVHTHTMVLKLQLFLFLLIIIVNNPVDELLVTRHMCTIKPFDFWSKIKDILFFLKKPRS